MDIEIIGDKSSAEAIISLTSQWDKSVVKGDAHALAKDYIENVEVFDISTQLVGKEQYKDLWDSC